MNARFLQIHTLTSYPAALLNRDDAGFAKQVPFGGAVRTRISSQCLKRHWRVFKGEHSLEELKQPSSVRSRNTFEDLIVRELVQDGLEESLVRAATMALMGQVLGKSEKTKKTEKGKKSEAKFPVSELQTPQLTVLGRPEIDYMKTLIREILRGVSTEEQAAGHTLGKEAVKNLQALKLAAGLDAALFGRMVTSDVLARCDAAIHVAHAFTVHEEAAESDYFSAVDDLLRDMGSTELGSAHINSTELTSGLFYGYVVVDVPHLVSNLEGCKPGEAGDANRGLTAEVADRLVHLMATVSPGAKLGSTAPYACATFVMAECGRSQPRTLANAFLKPVAQQPDLLGNTYTALARFIREENAMYGKRFETRLAGIGPIDPVLGVLEMKEVLSLKGLADWAADSIRRG